MQDEGKDRYGRVIGRVKCDGTDPNAAQVRRGMAWVYDRYAQEAKAGLWADAQPVPPWEWRKTKQDSKKKQ